jgi:fatty acid desaturase
MPPPDEDPVVRNARREAVVVFATWLVAMAYTIGYCALYGYNGRVEDLKFVWGFPDWVFYGIIAPWAVCIAVSIYFGATYMRDEDLGEELPEQEDELGLGG